MGMAEAVDDPDLTQKSCKPRKNLSDPSKWKKNQRKDNKNLGLDYTTCKGTVKTGRQLQPNPCVGRECMFKCGKTFSEQNRQAIFEEYWKLGKTPQRQRDFIAHHVVKKPIQRRRKETASNKRNFTCEYSLPIGGEPKLVCKSFFLSTLSVGERFVAYTVKGSSPSSRTAKNDGRGKHTPCNKTPEQQLQNIKGFIDSLPAVESHYCRANTQRKYLPQEYDSIANLYRMYKASEIEKKREFVLEKVFRNYFLRNYNIGFHVPKKDKCKFCTGFHNQATDDEEQRKKMDDHLQEKGATLDVYKKDQQLAAEDPHFVCASFDLEKVLTTPHGNSGLLFYSRKYAEYNFTVYESHSKQGWCYLWGESDAKRGSNEIATCLFRWLQEVDSREGDKSVQKISMYCDCCGGQNRNKQILAMLYRFCQTSKNVSLIDLKFLLTGHTYMQVDAMHSCVERATKNKEVWCPTEWETIVRLARNKPFPFTATSLSYDSFLDWKSFQEIHVTLPAKDAKKESFSIKNVRMVRFSKIQPGMIFIKYSMQPQAPWSVLHLAKSTGRPSATIPLPGRAYCGPQQICTKKYKDLIKLCDENIIPSNYQNFYRNLSHSETERDALMEPDEEEQNLTEPENDESVTEKHVETEQTKQPKKANIPGRTQKRGRKKAK